MSNVRVVRYAKDRGRLREKHICEICGSGFAVGRHHKFSQTKWARKLYCDLLDYPKNIQWACGNCHTGHASAKLICWNEREFCEAIGIAPRSYSEK